LKYNLLEQGGSSGFQQRKAGGEGDTNNGQVCTSLINIPR
jgi:hypothetical protein